MTEKDKIRDLVRTTDIMDENFITFINLDGIIFLYIFVLLITNTTELWQ